MRFFLVSFLCLVTALAGCTHKETAKAPEPARKPFQSVVINTPGVTGANCVVKSGAKSYSVIAPGAVMVQRSPETMSVSCFKGEHMRGIANVNPTYAPSEAQKVRGTDTACMSCSYPGTVTIAMSLNAGSVETPYRIFR